MGCGFKRNGPVGGSDDFEIHNLDLTALKLNVTWFNPFMISKRLSGHKVVTADQIVNIRPELERATRATPMLSRFVVLTLGGKLTMLDERLMDDLRQNRIAIIDRTTIDAVLNTEEQEQKEALLAAALVRFLGREALSPYESGRPARGGRFFGRSTIMRRLLPGGGNYTLIGNRRIGKTSVLQELRDRLKLLGFRTADVYGATCNSTVDVVFSLLTELHQDREAEEILLEPHKVRLLPSFIHAIPEKKRTPVAIFVDELDHILEFDALQKYEVLHLLRNTFITHDHCRIFLAGFRKVMEARQLLNTPPFNFTYLQDLPLFSREETYEMITKPLVRLGINVAGSNLPESIYRETGGHPELIQIHCSEIVRFFDKNRRVPSAADLLAHVFNTEEYKQKVLGTFLANTNSHEELLCYLLIADAEQTEHPPDYEFGPEEVNRVLKTVDLRLGIREIEGITTNLKVSGIVAPVSGSFARYRFAAPQLVNYCIALKLDFCIEKALERIKEAPDGELTIWSDPDQAEDDRIFQQR
jgi:hypothetical protein